MITLTSSELNYLVFRYLLEEGHSHTAYIFEKEAMLDGRNLLPAVQPAGLKAYVLKGIEMEYVENHTDEEGRLKRCTAKYSPFSLHSCTEKALDFSLSYLDTHESDVSLCAWTASDELLVGSQNCLLRLYNPPFICGEWRLGVNESSTHGITGIAVESGSRYGDGIPGTVSVGATHTGDLLVVKGKKEWQTSQAHKGPIVALMLQGDRLVSGGWDGLCKQWSASDVLPGLVEAQQWPLHKGPVMDILGFPTGFVTCSVDSTLCTVDQNHAPVKMVGHTGEVNAIKKTEYALASCSDDATVKLWRYGVPTPLGTLSGHTKEVYAIDTSGPYVLSGSFDSEVKLWDCSSMELVHTFQGHHKSVYTVAFSSDGHLAVSGGLDTYVCLWDTRAKDLVRQFGIGAGIYHLGFSGAADRIAICSSDPRPIILDLRR